MAQLFRYIHKSSMSYSDSFNCLKERFTVLVLPGFLLFFYLFMFFPSKLFKRLSAESQVILSSLSIFIQASGEGLITAKL